MKQARILPFNMKNIIILIAALLLSPVVGLAQNDVITKNIFIKKQATQPTFPSNINSTYMNIWFNLSGVPNVLTQAGVNTPLQVDLSVNAPLTKVGSTLSIPVATDLINGYLSATDHTAWAAHIINTSNPHSVTKAQVGLTNVTDDAQLKIANNLDDLNNATTARTNLGLGGAAILGVGTGSGDVAAGDRGVTNGDTHNHVGGDGGQIDHVDLSNIGTNTHSAIDIALAAAASHIANTSNPHSVTATQVGLGNVSNNAQLTIANNLSDLNNTTTARSNLGLGDSATKNVGTAAGDVAAGDRGVTNADAHDHVGGDGNPIVEGALSFTDITTNNATSSQHGLLPKLSGNATDVLLGNGSFGAVPGGGAVTDVLGTADQITSSGGATPTLSLPIRLNIGGSASRPTGITFKPAAAFSATGTVSVTINQTNCTGTGTAFLTELSIGDKVTVGAQARYVTTVTTDSNFTISYGWTSSASGQTMTITPATGRTDDSAGTTQVYKTDDGKLGLGGANIFSTASSLLLNQPTSFNNTAIQIITAKSGATTGIQFQNSSTGFSKIWHHVENATGADRFYFDTTGIRFAAAGYSHTFQQDNHYVMHLLKTTTLWSDAVTASLWAGGSTNNYVGIGTSGSGVLTRFGVKSTQIQFSNTTIGAPTAGVFIDVIGGKQRFAASTTAAASFNIPSGTAPTSPVDGDFWIAANQVITRLNSQSVALADLKSDQTFLGNLTFAQIITSSVATGTAPFSVASTTKVTNLNVDSLDGADWAAPADLGSTTPALVNTSGLRVGASDEQIVRIIKVIETLDFPSTSAGTTQDLTVTVTGAVAGDAVFLGAPNGSVNSTSVYFAWVSAADTITVRHSTNSLVTANDPASGDFTVVVYHY